MINGAPNTARRRVRSRTAAVAAATSAVLVLSACGAGGSGSTGSGTTGVVDPNGSLSFAWTVPPNNLDPHQSGNYQLDFTYLSLVFDRLTQIVGKSEVTPMLAESWEPTPDGRSTTFRLRTDATFHDGSPVNADAVVASLDRARDPQQSRVARAFTMIEGVEKVDDHTVMIRTNRPAADLPAVLATTEAAVVNPKAFGPGATLSIEQAGSGPYEYDQVRIGDRITYKRHEGYWDPEAQKAAELEVIGLTDDNARLNAFRGGQVDAILAKAGQADDLESITRQPQYRTHTFDITQFYALQLDIAAPGLADAKVRQALNYAIDRENINAGLTNGLCEPTSQPITAGLPGSDDESAERYSYDPERARELLKEAGAPSVSFDVITVTGLSPQQEMAVAIQSQLAEVGVNMNIKPIIQSDAQREFSQGGKGLLHTRLTYPTPVQTLLNNYMSPLRFPTPAPQDFQDAVNQALDPNLDAAARDELVSAASAEASEDAFDLFICALPTLVAYKDSVVGLDTAGQADFIGIVDLRYVGKTGA
ncbi:ABC transporter substrate-binding protein [Rhodococcus oxybenzonivorans]|uniref:ABC transporter substrate-binding protein n=1 Tax=Rhodococcus oxybenzonivorans TaxID=1990687 RepID=UPI0029549BAE|nr:ABC transporter substrate-binding protein [Rhodococcus oxybenzonivorans]MDV7352767.1 ABC transporter substrate-binding protein [Rhodococcus oxybenzonivorans]